MNKKKIIFLAILGGIAFILIIISLALSSGSKDDNKVATVNDFKIWILDDSKESFSYFIEDFKAYTWNKALQVTIESFNNYEEYNLALASAIIKWEAPDLYMLNNNEKSIFLENAIWIDPQIISPDDMRASFSPFFWDDLIISSWEWEEKIEFLVWIPFWYETLWLYFNIRKVWDVKKIKSFSSISNFISEYHDNKPWEVALWIGRWTTVENVWDIFAQFLMWEWLSSIWDTSSTEIKNVFSEYFAYASGDNNYIKVDNILRKSSRTNLDYFIDWEIAMIFGYPRMILDIDEKWFSKSSLQVINFPDFINESNKLVNYNYFVLNKDSKNSDIAEKLLKYIYSEVGEKAYLSHFKYYLPARVSLYSDVKDRAILDNFYIKLKNFYNSEAIYSSFDKWLKSVYDRDIVKLVDDEVNYLDRASNFVYSIKCKTAKVIKLEDLSKSCE